MAAPAVGNICLGLCISLRISCSKILFRCTYELDLLTEYRQIYSFNKQSSLKSIHTYLRQSKKNRKNTLFSNNDFCYFPMSHRKDLHTRRKVNLFATSSMWSIHRWMKNTVSATVLNERCKCHPHDRAKSYGLHRDAPASADTHIPNHIHNHQTQSLQSVGVICAVIIWLIIGLQTNFTSNGQTIKRKTYKYNTIQFKII